MLVGYLFKETIFLQIAKQFKSIRGQYISPLIGISLFGGTIFVLSVLDDSKVAIILGVTTIADGYRTGSTIPLTIIAGGSIYIAIIIIIIQIDIMG